jgi:hypothetical protein
VFSGKYQAAVYNSKDDGQFEIVDNETIGMVDTGFK